MDDAVKRFTFRIPADLFCEIEQIAKINHRSVNSEVIIAVEDYVRTHQSPKESSNE